jgi:hypothetical protein
MMHVLLLLVHGNMSERIDCIWRRIDRERELMTILNDAAASGCALISLKSDENTKVSFFAIKFLTCVVKQLYFRQKKFVHQL